MEKIERVLKSAGNGENEVEKDRYTMARITFQS
jgi:hypothetical protein